MFSQLEEVYVLKLKHIDSDEVYEVPLRNMQPDADGNPAGDGPAVAIALMNIALCLMRDDVEPGDVANALLTTIEEFGWGREGEPGHDEYWMDIAISTATAAAGIAATAATGVAYSADFGLPE